MKLPFIARIQDGGDGSQVVNVYNTDEELLADHESVKDGTVSAEDVLSEAAPYECGYIARGFIEIEDGKFKPFGFSGG